MKPIRAIALLGLAPFLGSAAQSQTVVVDGWSPLITWRTTYPPPFDWYVAPIHATLLPDSRVLFTGEVRPTEIPSRTRFRYTFAMTPEQIGEPFPPGGFPDEVQVADMRIPFDFSWALLGPWLVTDALYCSGHTLTSDGAFFAAGGLRTINNFDSGMFYGLGLPYGLIYDGTTWTRILLDMLGVGALGEPYRWYPTCTRLPDSRILVTGGSEIFQVGGTPYYLPNLSAETFDPATGTWDLVAPYPSAPWEIWNFDYTHVMQLPSPAAGADLLMFGNPAVPVLMSMAGEASWQVRSASPRPGTLPGELPNVGTSSAPLPIRVNDGQWGYANGSFLMAGGAHDSTHEHHVDVYDPVEDSWRPRIDMGVRRHHPSTVVLPDGRILVLQGHNDVGDPNVGRAQYVDPANEFSIAIGISSMPEVRGYHSIAVLLPDGRVLVGGGNDDGNAGNEKTNFRFYYPSYMAAAATRPQILTAPDTVTVGGDFSVTWSGNDLSEVVLVGPGSMTHSFDHNQRHVQLEVTEQTWTGGFGSASVLAPPDTRRTPPGHYMLFLLDENRTPSVAQIVHVTAP